MRVAVAGGTGAVGAHTVLALQRAGHVPVVLTRSQGVDLETGAGLDNALAGVDALVDVTNFRPNEPAATRMMFETATRHLLDAEGRANVRHHVLLSIVGGWRKRSRARADEWLFRLRLAGQRNTAESSSVFWQGPGRRPSLAGTEAEPLPRSPTS